MYVFPLIYTQPTGKSQVDLFWTIIDEHPAPVFSAFLFLGIAERKCLQLCLYHAYIYTRFTQFCRFVTCSDLWRGRDRGQEERRPRAGLLRL